MSAETISKRRFVCDHCGADETYSTDSAAGYHGWALINVNGKEFALCNPHKAELYAFLRNDVAGAFAKLTQAAKI